MMAANDMPSKGKQNFLRICMLVFDVIPDLLQDLLNTKLPPASGLSQELTDKKTQICKVLMNFQKNILYPQGGVYQGSVKDLDTSILCSLLRIIGDIPLPQKDQDKLLDEADRSLSANIYRLREQRNQVAHAVNASLSDDDFQTRCGIICRSVEDIQNSELNTDRFVVAVDNVLKWEMDHRMTNEYIEKLLVKIKEISTLTEDVSVLRETLDVMATDSRQVREFSPKIAAMIVRTKARIEEDKKRTFIATKGFQDAKEKLHKNQVLVIKGNTGDGKTTTAIHLILGLIEEQQGRQPLQLHNIKDLDSLPPKSKLITFIDDIFGEKVAHEKDVGEWNKRIESVLPTLCGDKPTEANFLLITIRNEAFNSLRSHSLENVFVDSNIIDLSSDVYKIEGEKLKLLELYKP
ncbi:uncharacterized protein LOC110463181 isoform X2 [Mizuhopecten yessoensis]|uniref:uncharacterized protein LOC110463181 isoform X2 n=1 Tax=Mizuhopecten yessoensis TaxID=6573 RepID=UPI000B45F1E6|nr:uncharacterized protein LOC110463181 isoform X2 [Mizuhopecten yessoensis]